MKQDMIVILDLGSTENTVLAREIRAMGVYSEIYPHDITAEELKALPNVKGVVIYGGPNHIVDGVRIDVNEEIYSAGYPIMSIDHEPAKCQEAYGTWEEALPHLRAFVFDTCHAEANWNMKNFVEDQIELIRRQVGDKKVLLALSGGVDSSVVAALLIRAIGKQLVCVHVNHGLMRKGESESVIEVFKNQMDANLIYVDATERYLSGTKTAKVVKSHHNVGGLPEDLQFKLVEPLRQLFKDEVRQCGLELGLPDEMVFRQPFPGPGLGVRCLGAITRERLEAVRESDAILREEFHNAGLDKKVWQYFTVVPDFKSVGVRDNARSFEYPVIIRAVNTIDAMSATIEQLEWPVLLKITDRILKEVKNVNRVCYDLSPKPTATIEFE